MTLTSMPLALVSVYSSTGSPSTSPKGSELMLPPAEAEPAGACETPADGDASCAVTAAVLAMSAEQARITPIATSGRPRRGARGMRNPAMRLPPSSPVGGSTPRWSRAVDQRVATVSQQSLSAAGSARRVPGSLAHHAPDMEVRIELD